MGLTIGLAYLWADGATRLPNGAAQIRWTWLPISLVAVWAYLLFALGELFRAGTLEVLLRPWRHVQLRSVIRAIALWTVLGIVFGAVLVPSSLAGDNDFRKFVANTIKLSVAKPGVFLIAHAVYFGPAAVLAALHWPRMCKALASWGPGLSVAATFALLMGLNSESRGSLPFLPILAIGTAAVLDEPTAPRWYGYLFAAITLIASKLWLPLNWGDWNSISSFPAQWYFMNHGPWMATRPYVVQGAICVGVGTLFYWAFGSSWFGGPRSRVGWTAKTIV